MGEWLFWSVKPAAPKWISLTIIELPLGHAMSGTTWTLEDDLNTVTVSFATNPPVALKLNASYVEDMLKNLGEFRALKQPVVPSDWTLSQQVQAIPNPRWFAEPEMMLGNTVLHLRDPRFGWLHYMNF
jgi:hypothetical protein